MVFQLRRNIANEHTINKLFFSLLLSIACFDGRPFPTMTYFLYTVTKKTGEREYL